MTFKDYLKEASIQQYEKTIATTASACFGGKSLKVYGLQEAVSDIGSASVVGQAKTGDLENRLKQCQAAIKYILDLLTANPTFKTKYEKLQKAIAIEIQHLKDAVTKK